MWEQKKKKGIKIKILGEENCRSSRKSKSPMREWSGVGFWRQNWRIPAGSHSRLVPEISVPPPSHEDSSQEYMAWEAIRAWESEPVDAEKGKKNKKNKDLIMSYWDLNLWLMLMHVI